MIPPRLPRPMSFSSSVTDAGRENLSTTADTRPCASSPRYGDNNLMPSAASAADCSPERYTGSPPLGTGKFQPVSFPRSNTSIGAIARASNVLLCNCVVGGIVTLPQQRFSINREPAETLGNAAATPEYAQAVSNGLTRFFNPHQSDDNPPDRKRH